MLGASLAAAHPLGNFSVNHSHNLSLEPQLIIDHAIVDFAEIPTAQSEGQVDTDGDGAVSPAELADRGRVLCSELLQKLTLMVDGSRGRFRGGHHIVHARAGSGRTPHQTPGVSLRGRCRSDRAPHGLPRRQLRVRPGRVARDQRRRRRGPVWSSRQCRRRAPPTSCRTYPVDLLDSPLDVRQRRTRHCSRPCVDAPVVASTSRRTRTPRRCSPVDPFRAWSTESPTGSTSSSADAT